ncbi:hypothetical protein [Candidatus Spongiihabitans sp.]
MPAPKRIHGIAIETPLIPYLAEVDMQVIMNDLSEEYGYVV